MALRPIVPGDHDLLREIYADAIENLAPGLYNQEQVRAWEALAWLPGILDPSFREGTGWISGGDSAFAIRHPSDRLSLLYCRGRAARQGHGSTLLNRIQADAQVDRVERLRTEASQMSRPLFERHGWRLIAPETITIAGVPFERYRMEKSLRQRRS